MGTSSMLHQALCTIPKPLVNSNWSYSPEVLNWDRNWWVLFDLEIWWTTLTYDRTPLLCHLKLCTSFCSHRSIQTGVTVQKSFRWKSAIFVLFDLEIWQVTLKNNRVPLQCYFKLCASFHRHLWIQTGVTVRKCPNWVEMSGPVWPWNLMDDLEKW